MATALSDHSFEEIRQVVLAVLAGRVPANPAVTNYDFLMRNVGQEFARRDRFDSSLSNAGWLSAHDQEKLQEVFWDLFRQGVVTLGMIDAAQPFPVRVSEYGHKILDRPDLYFYHDVTSYEKVIRENLPKIEEDTVTYLKEAMQAFMSGCLLSSTVMLGVAAEDAFLTLLETIENSPKHEPVYRNVFTENTIHRKIEKFRNILLPNRKTLPPDIMEDLETRLFGIQSMIREFRNDAGHPSGTIPSREQCYIMLSLIIPSCKKIYQLADFFKL